MHPSLPLPNSWVGVVAILISCTVSAYAGCVACSFKYTMYDARFMFTTNRIGVEVIHLTSGGHEGLMMPNVNYAENYHIYDCVKVISLLAHIIDINYTLQLHLESANMSDNGIRDVSRHNFHSRVRKIYSKDTGSYSSSRDLRD